MKTLEAVRAVLITTALATWPVRRGWAQVLVGPPASGASPSSDATPLGGMTVFAVVGAAVVMLLILGALVTMLDLKRKRDGEAVVVQAQISDAVLRDPRLFSLPITPTAHVPLWKGSPVTVEVAGQVPSDDLRRVALGVIEREAAHLRPDVQIESRIGVVPTMAR